MNLNDALGLVQSRVRSLAKYHLEPEETSIKLNQNENPFDWPAAIKNEVAEFCRTRPWNRYPDFIPQALRESLAAYTGVSADGIIVGNGSNEMLLVLLLTFMGTNVPVIICQPTFTVYRLLVNGLGGREERILLNPDLSFNVEAIIERARALPGSLLILCTPNNPTGGALTEADLRAILCVHTGIFICDQAYIEFGGYNAIPLLAEYPNLIITRTFSKAFSAAGLRLGYLLGAPALIAEINKIKLPYNVNVFSDSIARSALRHTAILSERVALLRAERDAQYLFLRAQPFDAVYPSVANFILVRTVRKKELFEFLKKQGILIRDVSAYPMLEGCLRISVGTPDENSALRSAISLFFNGNQS